VSSRHTQNAADHLRTDPRHFLHPKNLPAPFFGVSKLSWLDPCIARAVSGVVVDGLESAVLMLDVGVCGLATAVEVCTFRLAENGGEIRAARV
jgi:hypothetical protein